MNQVQAPGTSGTSERNHGVDLLKIVAMLFICILHVCNKGGVGVSRQSYPNNYMMVQFLKSLTYGALNMYAIISGFVGWNKKFKLSRPVLIWLELVFYTILGTALVSIFAPDLLVENAWFHAFMPVMNREYWYMTAYFGMVVLMPVLNAGIQKASMKTLSFTLLGVLVFFCVLPTIMDVDRFGLGNGYSTLWLCVMYVTGGYLAKMKKKPHPLITLALFVFLTLCSWLLTLKDVPHVLNYTSPTVALAAVCMVLTFSQIKIKPRPLQKIISFVVPSTLGIFIIHVHTFIWDNEKFLKNCAKAFAKGNAFLLGLMIIVCALIIFVTCGIVDVLRRGLFWLIRVKPLMHRVDKLLEKLFADKDPAQLPAEAAGTPPGAPRTENEDNDKGRPL